MLTFDEIKKKTSQRNQPTDPQKDSAWEDIKARTRRNVTSATPYWQRDVSNWFQGLGQIEQHVQKIRTGAPFDSDYDIGKAIDQQLNRAGKVKSLISANREMYADYQSVLKNVDDAISYLSQIKNINTSTTASPINFDRDRKQKVMQDILHPENITHRSRFYKK